MATTINEQFNVWIVDLTMSRVLSGTVIGHTPKYYRVIRQGQYVELRLKGNCFPSRELAWIEYYSRKIDHWANLMKTPESKRPFSLKHYHHGLKNFNCLERIEYFSKQLEKITNGTGENTSRD